MASGLKIGMVVDVKLGCSAIAEDRPEATVATLRLKPELQGSQSFIAKTLVISSAFSAKP